MNDLEFKQQILDTKSDSFCAAKWYNATIWLGSGQTTSCHHPPAHAIDVNAIKTNPSALHNTLQKKEDRRMMIAGEKPAGCSYCWKIESMGTDAVSDRVYKSKIYPIKSISEHLKSRSIVPASLLVVIVTLLSVAPGSMISKSTALMLGWCLTAAITLLMLTTVLNYTGLVKPILTLMRSLSGGTQTCTERSKN